MLNMNNWWIFIIYKLIKWSDIYFFKLLVYSHFFILDKWGMLLTSDRGGFRLVHKKLGMQ